MTDQFTRIKAILFDLDDTLLDRDRSIRTFCQGFHAHIHSPVEYRIFESVFLELDQKGYTDKRWLARQMNEMLALDIDPDWFESYFTEKAFDEVFFRDNSLKLLQELKRRGFRLGIVTNGSEQIQGKKIRNLGVEGLFDAIAISGGVGFQKPHIGIFAHICVALALSPEQCLFIGDNYVNDYCGSRNAGMHALLYCGIRGPYSISHLDDLKLICVNAQK